ncbi:uncharacterized protein N7496_012755 [Penicillium cataractarum]|uniref:Uncharacterized protein n=1 Tax=Penicillium cataractarum TaxID=2100454 RepID=A0A9W9RDI5_9EURO|nr:uncharacterized protein N7496_012755 [Penicillium cataractarum]KAJ5355543.1 hypothetical protein N7496_012755 [Penicillium cataractarum]
MHADNDLSRALYIGPYSSSSNSMHGRCFDRLFNRLNLYSNYELSSGWWRVLWRRLHLCSNFNSVGAMHNGRCLPYWVDLYSDCGLPHSIKLWWALYRDPNKSAEYSLHIGSIKCLSHRPDLYTDRDMQRTLHHYSGTNPDRYFLKQMIM